MQKYLDVREGALGVLAHPFICILRGTKQRSIVLKGKLENRVVGRIWDIFLRIQKLCELLRVKLSLESCFLDHINKLECSVKHWVSSTREVTLSISIIKVRRWRWRTRRRRATRRGTAGRGVAKRIARRGITKGIARRGVTKRGITMRGRPRHLWRGPELPEAIYIITVLQLSQLWTLTFYSKSLVIMSSMTLEPMGS
jgi:hypothetical protein